MEPLNMDCVRDLLVLIEENQHYKENGKQVTIKMKSILPMLDDMYSYEEKYAAVAYTREKKLVQYVNYDPKSYKSERQYVATGLTAKGHEFLASIRNDTVWRKVKKNLASIGHESIDRIIQLALVIASQ